MKKEMLNSINNQFNAFKDFINKIDTKLDIQSSGEKASNKELLEINYNALVILLEQLKGSTDKDLIINRINEIKLYLARYYADEWEVENSNFTNYNLSNNLALSVLWEIEWAGEVPKPPDMWKIISSFKWTWIWTYNIIAKINDWESLSNIFESKEVKDAIQERVRRVDWWIWKRSRKLHQKNR